MAEQVEQLTIGTTLHPGNLILTGTPAGFGADYVEFLKPGDTVSFSIENVGEINTELSS
jgi:2-keto-4-pentenoate hydratase/2-oxohepta-3-ene-1,7-dioic acid hydratase in catechol pathway